jgi:hypothetical protein
MKSFRLTLFLAVACMLFLLAGQTAFGATKTVRFQVSGCDWPVTETWARDAMWRTKGVKDVDSNWMLHWIRVTYDDEVTTVETLIKNLAHEGFNIQSQPEFLE